MLAVHSSRTAAQASGVESPASETTKSYESFYHSSSSCTSAHSGFFLHRPYAPKHKGQHRRTKSSFRHKQSVSALWRTVGNYAMSCASIAYGCGLRGVWHEYTITSRNEAKSTHRWRSETDTVESLSPCSRPKRGCRTLPPILLRLTRGTAVGLGWVALRCVALRGVALRCVALRCVALRCVVLCCVVLC